ncbi:type 1 glutamine amidotransferase [Natronolimnobius sp. AArcel1]|uniref:type 1 glutamine amidotransferase n=1 Tax=Natronolimnobius sp. AArcel1 TaxID=1679093 RepID=UPI0013ECD42C|nr:type 1 glutamine amidotransferase [Natronolimnobius sp. AArcel1]NGM68509.1 type 1 glutamine amidotransferase [Natronolimnobius sp. AArcel1]
MSEPTLIVVRNEVNPESEYHCDALESLVPNARALNFPTGERPDLESADGVVLTGSTAGVYERAKHPWIDDQLVLVQELVEREIPALGVCFGHQVANAALGGTVEAQETTCRPVEMAVEDGEPLFDGVSPIVPVAHGDVVTEVGDGMEVIASSDYYHAFATRHRDAPLWTVQFHPEFTSELRERLEADFGWTEDEYGFEDVTAARVVENFASMVAGNMGTTRP